MTNPTTTPPAGPDPGRPSSDRDRSNPDRGDAIAAVLRRSGASSELWLDVSGGSMGRSMPGGSRVLVVPGERMRRGQVWAFVEDDGRVLVHRFRRRAGDLHWFQGDANEHPDPPVGPNRLIGRVRRVDRPGPVRRLGRRATVMGRASLDGRSFHRRLRKVAVRVLREPKWLTVGADLTKLRQSSPTPAETKERVHDLRASEDREP